MTQWKFPLILPITTRLAWSLLILGDWFLIFRQDLPVLPESCIIWPEQDEPHSACWTQACPLSLVLLIVDMIYRCNLGSEGSSSGTTGFQLCYLQMMLCCWLNWSWTFSTYRHDLLLIVTWKWLESAPLRPCCSTWKSWRKFLAPCV